MFTSNWGGVSGIAIVVLGAVIVLVFDLFDYSTRIAQWARRRLDVFNWMEVRRNGEDIKVKMLNKAKKGGTPGPAKIGYVNTTINIDGHKVNTIAIDDERGPHMRLAFELAATGKYPNGR